MTQITFKENPVAIKGEFPEIGQKAPEAQFTRADLSDVSIKEYEGKVVVLNIFVSLDTGVCAKSIHQFNQQFNRNENVQVLHVSMDLPFAQKRFCETENSENSEAVSVFRSSFKETYGVELENSGLRGLCARSVIVLDQSQTIIHAEQVSEITQEPNYEAAANAVQKAVT